MSQQIKFSGKVTNQDAHPVANMVICLYREGNLVDRTSTDSYGAYSVKLTAGAPVTLCFNPGQSMFNNTRYNPSVVANVPGKKSAIVDRILLEAGVEGTQETIMDAIAAYGFLAAWRHRGVEASDTGSAPSKLKMLLVTTPLIADFQRGLTEYFQTLPEMCRD